jgi:hypothetical protein
MRGPGVNLKSAILDRMTKGASDIWTAVDFLHLGPRGAVDLALHRLVASKDIRRIARGLYDKPATTELTGKPTYPDYREVVDALSRRDRVRMVVDGITAANDLGLTDAVPARAVVLTDARLKPIKLGNLTITFQHAAPSRLHWAGRPAMRVVQALCWLRDLLPRDMDRIRARLVSVLQDPTHGSAIRDDLRQGLSALPEWMQTIVRDLLRRTDGAGQPQGKPKAAKPERIPRARMLGRQIISRMTMTTKTTLIMINSRINPTMIRTLITLEDCDDPRFRDRAGGFRE